jgi:hypothetical protein
VKILALGKCLLCRHVACFTSGPEFRDGLWIVVQMSVGEGMPIHRGELCTCYAGHLGDWGKGVSRQNIDLLSDPSSHWQHTSAGHIQRTKRSLEAGESQISSHLGNVKVSKPAGRRIGQDARLLLRIVGASIEPFFLGGPKAAAKSLAPADCVDRSAGRHGHELKAQRS